MLTQARCLEIARECLTEADWKKIVLAAIKAASFSDGADSKNGRDFIAKFAMPEKVEEAGESRVKHIRFEAATEDDYKAAQDAMKAKEKPVG